MDRKSGRTARRNILLLIGLWGCGAPGSDAVFQQGSQRSRDTGTPDSAAAPARQAPAPIVARAYRGQYYRMNDTSTFKPCGMNTPLKVTGTIEGRYLLAERFRLTAPWIGRPLFGVFQGIVRTDTLEATPADSGRVRTEQVFFITGLDSLRVWRSTDCGSRGR